MGQGIQIWNGTGQQIVDTSTSTSILAGITYATSAFNVVNSLFTKGIPFYFFIPRLPYNMSEDVTAGTASPIVNFSGSVMYVTGSNFDGTFYYGIY